MGVSYTYALGIRPGALTGEMRNERESIAVS
jgi:hypothetical protein